MVLAGSLMMQQLPRLRALQCGGFPGLHPPLLLQLLALLCPLALSPRAPFYLFHTWPSLSGHNWHHGGDFSHHE